MTRHWQNGLRKLLWTPSSFQPGEKAVLSLQLPEGEVTVFDPVVHMSQHIEVKGEPARESQSLSFVMTRDHAPAGTIQMRPGPLQMTLENRSNVRTLARYLGR